jgi:transposase
MSQNNHIILYAGLDVPSPPCNFISTVVPTSWPTTPKVTPNSSNFCALIPKAQIVCEATGGYERPVVRALHAAAAVSVIEAGRVRHFARAQGQRAKTDPIDAAVLMNHLLKNENFQLAC